MEEEDIDRLVDVDLGIYLPGDRLGGLSVSSADSPGGSCDKSVVYKGRILRSVCSCMFASEYLPTYLYMSGVPCEIRAILRRPGPLPRLTNLGVLCFGVEGPSIVHACVPSSCFHPSLAQVGFDSARKGDIKSSMRRPQGRALLHPIVLHATATAPASSRSPSSTQAGIPFSSPECLAYERVKLAREVPTTPLAQTPGQDPPPLWSGPEERQPSSTRAPVHDTWATALSLPADRHCLGAGAWLFGTPPSSCGLPQFAARWVPLPPPPDETWVFKRRVGTLYTSATPMGSTR